MTQRIPAKLDVIRYRTTFSRLTKPKRQRISQLQSALAELTCPSDNAEDVTLRADRAIAKAARRLSSRNASDPAETEWREFYGYRILAAPDHGVDGERAAKLADIADELLQLECEEELLFRAYELATGYSRSDNASLRPDARDDIQRAGGNDLMCCLSGPAHGRFLIQRMPATTGGTDIRSVDSWSALEPPLTPEQTADIRTRSRAPRTLHR